MFNTALDYIFIKFIVHLVFLYSKGLSLDSDGVNDANFLPPFSPYLLVLILRLQQRQVK
jgi:hypothetical protein